ncbi:MAG: lambda-exonuclease family protein [Polymorphobacter sp.]
MSYEIIDHDQGSTAWLHWRHGGIGASDAPALMGENPWKRPARLFTEKTTPLKPYYAARPKPAPAAEADLFAPARPAPPTSGMRAGAAGSSAMSRGNALEPYALALYCETVGVALEPACLQSVANAWQRASLDGINFAERRLVEIKCGDKVYAHTASTGSVPGYYIGQLQHILSVTGFAAIDFWVWLPGQRGLLLTVQRDDAYITRMTAAEADFWARVEAHRAA